LVKDYEAAVAKAEAKAKAAADARAKYGAADASRAELEAKAAAHHATSEVVEAAKKAVDAAKAADEAATKASAEAQAAVIPTATFVINGLSLQHYFGDETYAQIASGSYAVPGLNAGAQTMSLIIGWAPVRDFELLRYPPDTSCRPYSDAAEALEVTRPDYQPVALGTDNGIMLYPPKVFDVFTLRQMLTSTAAQLAGLAGFSQASINSAFGNLQGVTTDTSFLSAQLTTVATPTVVSQAVNGSSGSNTAGSAAGMTGLNTTSNSTITCPPGTLPGIGTSGIPACVLVVTSASGTTGNPVGFTGAGNVNGGASTLNVGTTSNGINASNSSSNIQNTNQQNTTTTTSGGQAGTIAPTLTSNLPAAPTNIGVSSQDILTEQVQLNSQITTLRLALQGALSDQYLVSAGRTFGQRQQTTLGINVSINPPERFRHAVAEVRVWVYAMGGKPVSIVNLLPAAKTYNVAKITSNQKAFGAGVVIDPVNVGAAAGKTKNRLFLAKDTDTVALEYPAEKDSRRSNTWPNGATPLGRSVQKHIRDAVHEAEIWQSIGDPCTDDPPPLPGNSGTQANPVIFGWQFRPVLGADYVQSGMRQVFAQLALPGSPQQGQLWAPKVYIQTRWREYDERRQVVGAVYESGCSITEDTDPISVQSPLTVKRVYVDDMGGGIVKVKADGGFYASGFTAMSGPTTLSPTTFDGSSIQFFANAESLLVTDDMKLAGEDGVTTELGVKPNRGKSCGIESASMTATPRPDGNAWVEVKVTRRDDYDVGKDGPLHPLILVGTQVYGLHETPFFENANAACSPENGGDCTYHFLASTSVLRSAETYTFRDLSWIGLKASGKVDFAPSFNGLTALASTSSTSGSDSGKGTDAIPQDYILGGTDFGKLVEPEPKWHCINEPRCFEVLHGLSPVILDGTHFRVTSPTTAVLRIDPQTPQPEITLETAGKTPTISLSGPTAKGNGSAAGKGAPAGKGNAANGKEVQPASPPPFILYTTDGSTPSFTSPNGIAAPPKSGPPIDPLQFTDKARTTIKAVAMAANEMPSEVAVARFYRDGTSVVPLFTQVPSPSNDKPYRFIWHWGSRPEDAVEWDLQPPDAVKSTVVASTVLNVGDSTQLEFSGVDALPNSPITFTFDGTVLANPLFSYDASKKTLKLLITTTITSKPGHKIIVMNASIPGADATPKATQILLPFDVTKR